MAAPVRHQGDPGGLETRDGSGASPMVWQVRAEQAYRMTSATPFPPSSTEQPPAAPSRPQLRRSGTESMLGGVCGGLAEYSGIDTVLWRGGVVAPAPLRRPPRPLP